MLHAVIVALAALSVVTMGGTAVAKCVNYHVVAPTSLYDSPGRQDGRCRAGRLDCWRRDVKEYDSKVLGLILTGSLNHEGKPRLGGYAHPDPRRLVVPRISKEEDRALRNLDTPLYRRGLFKPCDSCGPGYPKTRAAVLVLPDSPPETIFAAWKEFKRFRERRAGTMDFKIYLWTRDVNKAMSSLKSPEARSMFGHVHQVPIVIKYECRVCNGLDRRRLPAVIFFRDGDRVGVAPWPFDLARDAGVILGTAVENVSPRNTTATTRNQEQRSSKKR